MKTQLMILGLILSLALIVGCTSQPGTIVGGDKDEHGCIPSAGYSWCEAKQKCLRTWEENCSSGTLVGNDRDAHGCIPSAGYSWCEAKQKCLRTWEENCTKECGTCPQLSPPGPNFCPDGTIIAGEKNECGCQSPPKCVREENYCAQSNNCTKEGNYCVYDVSSALEYASPEIRVAKEYKVSFENTSSIMAMDNNAKNSIDFENYICVETGKAPCVVNFWYYATCKPGIDGCGWERKAIICGEKYFIHEMSSSEGPVLYGPFLIKV